MNDDINLLDAGQMPAETRLDIALGYVQAGISVIPIRTDGSKSPALKTWKQYQEHCPTEKDIHAWYGGNAIEHGIGIIGGEVSGGLEVIDFDDFSLIEPYIEVVNQLQPGLLDRLVHVESPRPGRHICYRCPGHIEGSQKLAEVLDGNGKLITLIETKSEGGYVVAPGSPRACHETGREYKVIQGNLSAIPTITPEERNLLIATARQFTEVMPKPAKEITGSTSKEGNRPGDDFNKKAHWTDILEPHGWQEVKHRGEITDWKRPGKSGAGISATTRYKDSDLLYVFSSNASPFEPSTGYNKFASYALLNHAGDFAAAAKELGRQGYGDQTSSTLSVSTPVIWPEPGKINDDLLPVTPMPEEIIPEPFRDWLADESNRKQCPIEGLAIAAIVIAGSVIGTGCTIRPKAQDDWLVVPNLWGCLIGRPSIILKSPALKAMIAPLHKLELQAKTEYESKQREHEVDVAVHESREEAIKQKARKSNDTQQLKQELLELSAPEKPSRRRYETNDATCEKITELLAHSPRGILLFRDELTGWLESLGREGREGARQYYIEGWDGDGRHADDKIGRGTTEAPNLCISVLGGIQPDKLQVYLYQAMHKLDNDGLVQRLQLAVYPDEPVWAYVDKRPNYDAKKKAFAIFEKLACIDFAQYGATQEEYDRFPYLHFDKDAQDFFKDWLTDLQRKKIAEPQPLLQEHLGKYASLMPILAVISHLVEFAAGLIESKDDLIKLEPVSKASAEKAAAWCDILEEHARRIYGLVGDIVGKAASALAKKLWKNQLPDRFSVRDVQRKQWSLLTDSETIKAACELLADPKVGYLMEEVTEKHWQQKQTVVYRINPKVSKGLIDGKVSE